MEKHKTYYYYDERNDDFANNGIDGKPTPENFEYLPKNIFYRIAKPIVYYFFLVFIFFLATAVTDGYHVHNAKVLRKRKDRKKGYFVFGNHTTWIGDAVIHPTVAFPKQVYTLVNPDAISIKGAGTLIKMFGAMPTPASRYTYAGYIKATEKLYNNGNPIVIYPEAHIWPKYNKIRDFADVSFNLPVKLGAPCYAKSTVYYRQADGHTKSKVFYDGPFYPDPTLSPKAAQKDLRDRIHAKMQERCAESELDSRYSYIKVDSPDQVRTETTCQESKENQGL